MKIAILMVSSAISLFAGTVIWGARTPVERTKGTGIDADSAPDRKSANSWYYQSEHARFFTVYAPVHVELDENFSGVEILGDTSVFKYFDVQVNKNPLLRASIKISTVTATSPARNLYTHEVFVPSSIKDSINYQLLDAANITIRIGIGKGSMDSERYFEFYSCKTIKSIGEITNAAILMDAEYADSLILAVHAKNFELHARSGKVSKLGRVAQLSGTVNQAHYLIEGVDLQAHDLLSKETYFIQSKNSNIDIFATEIANARQMVNCPLKISGNPPYQRIEERQQ